ncbi:MAG: PQQ-binding-like beta-propeller repeat protein [Gammaproteobacteria bacterium]|nr:PQQ-binding-like beta-propeller repeat protein [Gammaproteobacteria bacterium]
MAVLQQLEYRLNRHMKNVLQAGLKFVIVFSFQVNLAANDFPNYTSEQATLGKAVYEKSCQSCHGENLNDGSSVPIAGDVFYSTWGGRTVAELLKYLESDMPQGAPGALSLKEYSQVLAYMFHKSGFPEGDIEVLSADSEYKHALLPVPASGRVSADIVTIPPDPNPRTNPLDSLSSVSTEMLEMAPAEDWLMWRRTYDAKGFSPLKKINVETVADLKVAWAWSMPPGRNISTPLVHDGVLYMYGAGSLVYAFNAKTGDILWRYKRNLNSSTPRTFGPRAIALYLNKVILTTDDGHIVALDAKSGKVSWDKNVLESDGFWYSGGPLIAKEKVLIGTTTASGPGLNYISALDVHTGDEVWRFYTIAQKGEAGNTWNGAAAEKRQGASIWIPPSYDSEQELVFFGTGNTYRPQLLSDQAEGSINNDGLYTNSTLALDINTGKLVWYFQHLPNDQWNYDWAFERTLTTLSIKGKDKNVVITGGKQGIFEAMQIDNGKYLFSIDLGLQNVISNIDPLTGDKKIANDVYPVKNNTRFVCPDSLGNRNWQATSYNKNTNTLFTTVREACMKIRSPMLPGDTPHGHFGQKPYPRTDSDGNFGGLRAIDIKTRKILWSIRKRPELSTSLLATAGDLIFSGARDRFFSAYAQTDGRELWRTRLNGVPAGGPISYMVESKQYVAVSTGDSEGLGEYNLGDADRNPKTSSATIWVFELRESQ